MANIILPQVNILNEINDSATMLVEQNGEINRFSIADLDIGGGDVTINLEDSNISKPNPVNADTLGGRSPEEYIALANDYTNQQVKKAAPRNLLDNSDFRNPVNQRGQTSYSASGYTIDRWRILDNGAVTVNNGYITVIGGLFAYLEKKDVKNVKHTLVGCKPDGTMHILSHNPFDTFQWGDNIGLGDDGSGVIVIDLGEGDYVWAALYEGEYTADTLPEYQPKGYANELLACNVADTGNVSGMELLWENASPGSQFASQTVVCNISEYDFVYIDYFESTLNSYHGSVFFHAGFAATLDLIDSSGRVIFRQAPPVYDGSSPVGFAFSGALVSGQPDNNYTIPYRIYGIKGVSE